MHPTVWAGSALKAEEGETALRNQPRLKTGPSCCHHRGALCIPTMSSDAEAPSLMKFKLVCGWFISPL